MDEMYEIIFSDSKFTLPLTGATNVPLFADVENAATINIGRTTNKSLVMALQEDYPLIILQLLPNLPIHLQVGEVNNG